MTCHSRIRSSSRYLAFAAEVDGRQMGLMPYIGNWYFM